MTDANYSHCAPQMLLEAVDGDQETFLELAEIFVRESASRFADLKAAAAAGEIAQLGRHSHSLKGTVGPLGADRLVRMLQEVENECNKGKCDCGAARFSAIESELNQVTEEVQHFVARI